MKEQVSESVKLPRTDNVQPVIVPAAAAQRLPVAPTLSRPPSMCFRFVRLTFSVADSLFRYSVFGYNTDQAFTVFLDSDDLSVMSS